MMLGPLSLLLFLYLNQLCQTALSTLLPYVHSVTACPLGYEPEKHISVAQKPSKGKHLK